jgi:competence protein ComEA
MEITREQKYILLVIAAVLISGLVYGLYSRFYKTLDAEIFTASADKISEPCSADLIAHVSGAVKKEGVFKLRPGSRMLDAVNAAGGFLLNADISSVNLAEQLMDGSKIVIPFKILQPESLGCNLANGVDSNAGTINLNTAKKEELMKIPGVGDVTAKRIIEFREKNGRFVSVDDLKKVGGIGDKKLEKMKPYITI